MTNQHHIDELRAELRNCTSATERRQIEREIAEAIRAGGGGD